MFIKQHSEIRASKGNGYLLYVQMNYDPRRAFTLLREETFEQALEIDIPFQPVDMYLVVIGSCKGLLCVTDTEMFGSVIYLCNPYIRRCRVINHPIPGDVESSDDTRNDSVSLGFGYYDKTDDYKIVRIVVPGDEHDQETANRTNIEVYSSSTNSWKSVVVEGFSWSICDVKSELVVGDSVHWRAFHKYTNKDVLMILAFHLGNETFQQIRLPNYEVDGEDMMECITLYKGNLSLFLFHKVDRQHPWQGQYCYLWVMKEYGVYGSWTKTLTVTVAPAVLRPLGFTRNDEIVFEDCEQDLVVCHFGSITAKALRVEATGLLYFGSYMDSLVLL
ncbi:UNVERIFIED_CONTAM: F-box protein [Sesamum radiatum]|uniref:F-box protein n=1 Tax=Sesamum radiatum TaxID=300843 RepID=A0AAW2U760_SESRA